MLYIKLLFLFLHFHLILNAFFSLFQDLKAFHRPQIECLTAAEADLIAFETIPSIKEGEALVQLLREFPNAKAWLSFSCKVMRA